MSLDPLSVTLPLTPNSTFTSTPRLSRVGLGAKKLPDDRLQKLPSSWFTKIMTCLDPYSICVLTSVSASLYDSFDEERWGPLCQQFFPESYKKHTECLKSSPPDSRHFFMGQFNLIKGRLNFNQEEMSDFLFKGALSEHQFLLQNCRDKSLILWNTKEGKTIKRWIRPDPIQEYFTRALLEKESVLDGRAVLLNFATSGITIHDLIGENKILTVPCADSISPPIAFGKNQLIYKSYRIEFSGEKRVCKNVWNIWDAFTGATTILWPDAPSGFVHSVYVLDDKHIVAQSDKILTVWHVASQQASRTCTEATTIDIVPAPAILKKRYFVYTVPEGDKKVKVWDTLNDTKNDLPIFSKPNQLCAFNERLLICRMKHNETIKIVDILESHRQKDVTNFHCNISFLPLNTGCAISLIPNELGIWDDSAYQEELFKRNQSSTSSSSSDSSSSSNSSEQYKAINSSPNEEKR